jgi:hypothetical protein
MNGTGTKHVCGFVAPDRPGVTGVSFKVQKITTGVFEALLNDEFHEVPAVSVTQIYPCPKTGSQRAVSLLSPHGRMR